MHKLGNWKPTTLTLFGPGLFYCLKVQGGVVRDPLKSQEPLNLAQ